MTTLDQVNYVFSVAMVALAAVAVLVLVAYTVYAVVVSVKTREVFPVGWAALVWVSVIMIGYAVTEVAISSPVNIADREAVRQGAEP